MATHSSIEIEIHSARACIVTLRGEHDLGSRPELTMALTLARGYDHVLVDLAPCTFIDATLTGVLLRAATQMRAHDASLELVVHPAAHATRRLLGLASAGKPLRLHETRAAGIAALAAAERRRARREARREPPAASGSPDASRGARTERRRGMTVIRARVVDDGPGVAGPDPSAVRRGRADR